MNPKAPLAPINMTHGDWWAVFGPIQFIPEYERNVFPATLSNGSDYFKVWIDEEMVRTGFYVTHIRETIIPNIEAGLYAS